MDWIPTWVRVPQPLVDVLALHQDEVTGEKEICIEWRDYEGEWIYNHYGPVTHWMPLPELPEEE